MDCRNLKSTALEMNTLVGEEMLFDRIQQNSCAAVHLRDDRRD